MKINLHIERLVLEGLPIQGHHGPQVKAAIEAELGRLLAADGLLYDGSSGGARTSFPASEMQLTGNNSPRNLGREIARALHGGIGK